MHTPTFLILGAPKCGTTSLYHYLGQHPDVFFSSPKEPPFFEAEYERGLAYYWETYFKDYGGERAIGEARTFNLYVPFVAPRIGKSLPDAKLIVALRNPVDRAYSHWWHRFSRGVEDLSFGEAVEANFERMAKGQDFEGERGADDWKGGLAARGALVRHRIYVDCGHYADQIRRYLAFFSRTRLEVVRFEDLSRDPVAVTRRLCEFIGVPSEAGAWDLRAQNVSRGRIQNPALGRLIRFYRGTSLHRWIPRWVKDALLTGARVYDREADRPPMEESVRRRLVEHYRGRNAELGGLLGSDFSEWNAGGSDGDEASSGGRSF